MSAQKLGSRAIIGHFFKRLRQLEGQAWVNQIAMSIGSDQASEEYAWLGQIPGMREWVGERQAKGFSEFSQTIINKHFEATIEVMIHELRRDKTGQVMIRIAELARRTNSHWAKLLSDQIVAGIDTACYDSQFFFDTDHTEGRNTTSQSNDISVDISALPVSVNGVVTAPSVEEMQLSIVQGIQAILGITDNENEPMNEDATDFLVMTPLSLWATTQAALANPMIATGASQTSLQGLTSFNISAVPNVRLDKASTAWTDEFCVFRTDAEAKPFIKQEETPVNIAAIAEDSELEFREGKHEYGVDAWRNTGFGFWQDACLVTMT